MRKSLLAGVSLALLAFAAPASAELKFAPGADPKFNWADYETLKQSDLKGETLTVFGPWRGADEDLFQSILEYFREATGADVKYSSSENYEQQIVIDTQAGSPPNIAILPQPGLIQDLASKGLLTPLGDANAAYVKDNYGAGDSWVSLGTYKDKDGAAKFFAFPYKADLKSLVWYSPDNFEEAGYEVPKTWEDMMALSEKIIADGGTPWCIGMGSGGATGWPAHRLGRRHHAAHGQA
jgi:alpha-glucoside transport system substrate-binding protein